MSGEESLLTAPGCFKHKVSSTLNSSAEFASKHMFDESGDSCWNSGPGSPQFIIIDFTKSVHVTAVEIMFQGGFVGQEGNIEAGMVVSDMEIIRELPDIKDMNEIQRFDISYEFKAKPFRYMKITFQSSTDFYGRVTIYSLKVFGTPVV